MEWVIDLNADVGEGGPDDESLISSGITSANVACGGHAGDDDTMGRICEMVRRHGVALGAHPGYEDRAYFGRRVRVMEPEVLRASLSAQLWRLQSHAHAVGLKILHVKPHGALYHQANTEVAVAEAILDAMQRATPEACLLAFPEGALRELARQRGVRYVAEGFVDRRYLPSGQLMPRSLPEAMITNEDDAVAQALALARSGQVQSLCVHGDGLHALRLLAAARRMLMAEAFRFSPPR